MYVDLPSLPTPTTEPSCNAMQYNADAVNTMIAMYAERSKRMGVGGV